MMLFKYKIVKETENTIYESYIKKWNFKNAIFLILFTVITGLIYLALIIKVIFFVIGGITSFIPGYPVTVTATCDYSVRNKYYGISNNFYDEKSNSYKVKSDTFICGIFDKDEKLCQIDLERNWLGDRYKSVTCKE